MPLLTSPFVGKTKPGPGAAINWDHPLAPKTKTGFFLPCNGGGKYPVDLVQNIRWSGLATSANEVGFYRPVGPPDFHNPMSLRLTNTPAACYKANTTTPNTVATLAAIGANYTNQGDGPRWIGLGNDNGMILEPGHGGSGVFKVLYGGIAHYATSIPFTLGHWYFFGACARNNGSVEVYVRNYTTGKSYYQTLSVSGSWNTPNYYVVGGTGSGGSRLT